MEDFFGMGIIEVALKHVGTRSMMMKLSVRTSANWMDGDPVGGLLPHHHLPFILYINPSIHLAFHVETGSKSISLSSSHALYEITICFYFLSSCSLSQPVNLHSLSLIILISSAQISAGQAAVIFSHTR